MAPFNNSQQTQLDVCLNLKALCYFGAVLQEEEISTFKSLLPCTNCRHKTLGHYRLMAAPNYKYLIEQGDGASLPIAKAWGILRQKWMVYGKHQLG